MVIKETINVSDNRLLDGLVPVVRIMSQVEVIPKEEDVIEEPRTWQRLQRAWWLALEWNGCCIAYTSKCIYV